MLWADLFDGLIRFHIDGIIGWLGDFRFLSIDDVVLQRRELFRLYVFEITYGLCVKTV